jgi:hypothetical protein
MILRSRRELPVFPNSYVVRIIDWSEALLLTFIKRKHVYMIYLSAPRKLTFSAYI